MIHQGGSFLFWLLFSFVSLHGMESVQSPTPKRKVVVKNFEKQAEKLIKQKNQQGNTNGFCYSLPIACDDDLCRVFSKNYEQFANGLSKIIKGERVNGINILNCLAKQGDIPSKYLLSWYYDNKDLNKLNNKTKIKLEKKKNESKEWLIDAVKSNYPLAEFDYGIKLLKKGDFNRGFIYIEAAAMGGWIEYPDQTVLRCYYLPAVAFLTEHYNKYYPNSDRALQMQSLKNYLIQVNGNKPK